MCDLDHLCSLRLRIYSYPQRRIYKLYICTVEEQAS
jgi:hypothetical protein